MVDIVSGNWEDKTQEYNMALTWDLNSVFEKMEESGIERPEHLLISNGGTKPNVYGCGYGNCSCGHK